MASTLKPQADCSFNPKNSCSYRPENNCSFTPKNDCSFKPQDNCSFKPQDDCSFKPQDDCSFKPQDDCSFKPQDDCSFKPQDGCSFTPKNSCSYRPENNCTFKPRDDCSFKPQDDCSFTPKDDCTFDPKNDCAFHPKNDCSFKPKNTCSFIPKDDCSFPNSATNINHVGYNDRMATVAKIIESQGLQARFISTLIYDEECHSPHNSFLFKVELQTAVDSSIFAGMQFGTAKAPMGDISTVMFQLIDPTPLGLNNADRVENHVASKFLARQAMLELGGPCFIPATYAWKAVDDKAKDWGWLICEYRDGVALKKLFPTLAPSEQELIMEDIATVLKAIQIAHLPHNLRSSGLSFDQSGQIIGGHSPLEGQNEPAATILESKLQTITRGLKSAEESPVIQGWKADGLCDRISKFLQDGAKKLLNEADAHPKTLFHADFTTDIMLLDPQTKRLSAILEFDMVSIAHPLTQFNNTLFDLGGNLTYQDPSVCKAILFGSFEETPAGLSVEALKQWDLAKRWNRAMIKKKCLRPCEIKGAQAMFDFGTFVDLVCPFQLVNEGELTRLSEEQKSILYARTKASLEDWLKRHGY